MEIECCVQIYSINEVIDYSTTKYASSIRNILGRLKGILQKAITDNTMLPKVIVIVIDDDIIKQCNDEEEEGMTIIISYLLTEFHCILTAYKSLLLTKSKRDFYPQVIWIAPPTHKYFVNNYARVTFTRILEEVIFKKFDSMCCLRLKKIWDTDCGGVYLKDERHFTPEGLYTYWRGVDTSIKFWDRTLAEILCKKQKKIII